MVHVELSEDLYLDLCRLKFEAREYWDHYYSINNLDNKKGKVSIDEVIRFLYYSRF